MTPIQQLYLGVGASKKTYVDDIFSTHLYKGTGTSSNQIVNNIDLSNEGGMVWIKKRDGAYSSILTDTVRGGTKYVESNSNVAEETDANTSFNSNGFTVDNTWHTINSTDSKYSSWTFRKAPGFFDVVTYTGNDGASRAISHSLGSVPGMIMIKRLDASTDWVVYHRNLNNSVDPHTYILELNKTTAEAYLDNCFTAAPTSSTFTVGDNSDVNQNSNTYVAYLFAGGESTNALARSVELDGTGDYLSIASSSDFAFGTGDFTWEGWFKLEDDGSYLINFGADVGTLSFYTWGSATRRLKYYNDSAGAQEIEDVVLDKGQWYHFAVARSSNTTKVFINGIEKKSFTDNKDYGSEACYLGASSAGGSDLAAKMSNVRIVKGTAVYTSSFRPPTEPLTNITNTKLLCCNDSSTTGSTVTPGTITANGNPQSSTDSPFDDPAGFAFGDSKEGIIKCGSYVGNGDGAGPEINLGFEPQWLLIKRSSGAEDWILNDCIRGITTGGNNAELFASTTDSESDVDRFSLTSTGFKITTSSGIINGNNDTYIYLAIRRPDGYVGKPADAGTDVFAMGTATGNSGDDIDSGFPVDFGLAKRTATSESWYTSARLISGKYLYTDTTDAQDDTNYFPFDNNVGWTESLNSGYQAWMWKRHAGFDVVTEHITNSTGQKTIKHSMNAIPEMIWQKHRGNSSEPWRVYHKGLNEGTNPHERYLTLNSAVATANAGSGSNYWGASGTLSTSSFELNSASRTTGDFIFMLFSSVDGISKCGFFDGDGSTDGSNSINVGFQPRFILIKCTTAIEHWILFDTLRGISTSADGNDSALYLSWDNSQSTTNNWLQLTSTGWNFRSNNSVLNGSSDKYIYYAHA